MARRKINLEELTKGNSANGWDFNFTPEEHRYSNGIDYRPRKYSLDYSRPLEGESEQDYWRGLYNKKYVDDVEELRDEFFRPKEEEYIWDADRKNYRNKISNYPLRWTGNSDVEELYFQAMRDRFEEEPRFTQGKAPTMRPEDIRQNGIALNGNSKPLDSEGVRNIRGDWFKPKNGPFGQGRLYTYMNDWMVRDLEPYAVTPEPPPYKELNDGYRKYMENVEAQRPQFSKGAKRTPYFGIAALGAIPTAAEAASFAYQNPTPATISTGVGLTGTALGQLAHTGMDTAMAYDAASQMYQDFANSEYGRNAGAYLSDLRDLIAQRRLEEGID